jgi:LuxR family transcriptional regulator, maltose regulon positive regulatory protein
MDERADLLLAKLIIPRTSPDQVGRPDLVKRLDQGMAASLILVCAPPGFGKTTLLADWACGQDQPVAWLSLDREDNDPARFWRYVVAALDRVCEGLGQRFGPLLAGPAVLSSEGVATALINELEALSGEVVLVLDDYHVIESASIHNGLAFLLGHLPGQLHLVISSRSDPPLPVARLRAGGQLAELRARDLRFTPEESAAFLEKVWGLDLSAEAFAALEAKTEGWAAGLQLAALSLRGRPDPEAFLEAFTGSHRYVLDYLSEEVLERQPDRVRAFLLETSILDRLSGPACDAVTRAADSQRMLEELERANLFLVPLDEERRWYRYHHLFADLLRARLAQTQPDRALELHTRAAAWCAEHGLIDEAIRHATAAGDADWAMRLVEEHLDETLRHGEDVTLTRWLAALPEDAVRSAPAVCLAHGLMQLHLGQLDTVERLLRHAERGFDARRASARHGVPTTGGLVAELPAAIAFLCAELAGVRGDSAGTAAYARSALSHLRPDEHGPGFWGRWLLAYADWIAGRLEAAERAFAALVAEGRAAPDLYPLMSTGSTLAQVQRARGRLSAALRTSREGLRYAMDGGRLSAYFAGELYVGIAQVLYERNELDEALEHVTKGIELCRHVMMLRERDRGLVTHAWIRQAMGEADAALDAMTEACRMYPAAGAASLFHPAPAERARLLVAQGGVDEAARWTDERGLTAEDEVSWARERDLLVLARVLLARSEPLLALGFLGRLDALAASQGRVRSLIEIRGLQSLALQASGEHGGALAVLAEALALAAPEGYVRVFVDEGPPMAALLRGLLAAGRQGRAPARSGAGVHLHRVVQAFGSVRRDAKTISPAVTGLLEPLTDRELEVLRLLAKGKRNQDIAVELVVTLETVKKHVSHIFAKLGAANRTEAVVYARRLGLIA